MSKPKDSPSLRSNWEPLLSDAERAELLGTEAIVRLRKAALKEIIAEHKAETALFAKRVAKLKNKGVGRAHYKLYGAAMHAANREARNARCRANYRKRKERTHAPQD